MKVIANSPVLSRNINNTEQKRFWQGSVYLNQNDEYTIIIYHWQSNKQTKTTMATGKKYKNKNDAIAQLKEYIKNKKKQSYKKQQVTVNA